MQEHSGSRGSAELHVSASDLISLGWVSPNFTDTANAALQRARLLEWTDTKQIASSHPALASHQLKGERSSQKLQDNLRAWPDWQPQPSRAEHSLRDEHVASAEKPQDLNSPGLGAAQPDASQPTPIQAPLLPHVSAEGMPGIELGGIQSTLRTMTPASHVEAAPQHVAVALEERPQPTQRRGDVPNMRPPAASGPSEQSSMVVNQPAAAQMFQQEGPPPDGSAQPGRWRTKHRTAAQLDGSKQAACTASLQHNEGGRCAEDEAGSTRADYACAAEGVAAMPGSRQYAVDDTVQAEDTPPWLSEQVFALAVDIVMAR